MKRVIVLAVLCAASLVMVKALRAADHYIRAGATGSNNGNDWTNAYPSFPSIMARGDTYYVAAGSYNSYQFDDAESGTQVITVRKATETSHGTGIGWQSAYGTGEAVFNNPMIVTYTRSYYVFDGQSGGGPGSWKSGHGFRFTSPAGTNTSYITLNDGVSHITIRHCYFTQTGNVNTYTTGASAIYAPGSVTAVVIEYCYMDNLGALPFFFRGGSNVIIQYNYTGYICGMSRADANQHCEAFVLHSLGDVHFRWNYVADCPSSGGVVKNNTNTSNGVRIYGNIFRSGSPIACNSGPCTNWRIFNNTFASSSYGPFSGDGTVGNDTYVYNNIIYGLSSTVGLKGSHDYNWYSSVGSLSCNMGVAAHENITKVYPSDCDRLTVTTNPFINASGTLPEDFKLAAALASWGGYDVGQLDAATGEKKYNQDMFGTVRGADGVWDRGAFEYATMGVTNAELQSAKYGLKDLIPNPLSRSAAARLVGIQLYDLQGHPVQPEQVRQSGVFLAGNTAGVLQKVTVLK